ncbi:hypothetical protein Tco_1185696 [Tanacetum coccineum]
MERGFCNKSRQLMLELRNGSILFTMMMTRDEESSITLRDIIISELPSVEDLVHTPSESDGISESECDLPICDDSFLKKDEVLDDIISIPPGRMIEFLLEEFAGELVLSLNFPQDIVEADFDPEGDDESLSDEDVPEENFKIYSNPLFDEEIISTKIDPHHFNAESDLIESLLNQDTSMVSSPKIESLLGEFSSELAHIDLIPPGIDETDFNPEEYIRLVEKLLYDNSSPRPPEELNSEIYDAIIESFSPSPIPIESSDSLMKEIDIFLALDDSIPPSIENDDYDSKGDILFLKEFLSNDSLSLPENESFHFDRYYPSSPRPPAKPPDDDGIHFDIEPDKEILTAKVVDDISEHYVLMPSILPTHPTRCPVIDTLLPFSPENENKVFNSSILTSNEEKSLHLLSHRGFKAFQIISDFFESPMMIYRGDNPILDVPFLHFYPP